MIAGGNVISIDGSLATTVGVKNPYRYRGYRYDEETKLYYPQSRYYNPEWGRFVNADDVKNISIGKLLTANLFAYCLNNTVNLIDIDGNRPKSDVFKRKQSGVNFRLDEFIYEAVDVTITVIFIYETFKFTKGFIWQGMKNNANNGLVNFKNTFPQDPNKFNPKGLIRKEYNKGKIIKWHDPTTGKAIYEWNADAKYGDHYHYTPDGKNRMPHPDTGDTHIKPGQRIP
ncbi:tRNA nuclease WapA precursor [Caloramator mitchellensis]|uniref:tRNA nuclease WapA n=1 Tax=Caloramator mitchellensis TaxID=908809 RepID=A0A0R3JTF5_CALMK|nr:RHS repeat-associated core domain-containing protein [Caloramator mitchellensis]KRQ86779.1 tRNA nuclease WapA precursor [Caloramator mitchellensis]